MRKNILLAAVAATFVAATPAFAQVVSDTTPGTANGVVLQSHSLLNSGNLDFGMVSTDLVSAGSVVIEASAAGTRTNTGGVVLLPGRPWQAAKFDGKAAP